MSPMQVGAINSCFNLLEEKRRLDVRQTEVTQLDVALGVKEKILQGGLDDWKDPKEVHSRQV